MIFQYQRYQGPQKYPLQRLELEGLILDCDSA